MLGSISRTAPRTAAIAAPMSPSGSRDNGGRTGIVLEERPENRVRAVVVEAAVLAVLDDADDLEEVGSARLRARGTEPRQPPESQPAAERALARPEPRRERAVDDHHELAVLIVELREIAPFLEARPHGPEITGRDPAHVGHRRPDLPLRRRLLGKHTPPPEVQVDRDDVGERRVSDAGQDADRIEQAALNLPPVLAGIALQPKVERHLQRALRREPERHRLRARERAPHEPGAGEQDERHRHLHDDQRVAPRHAPPVARRSRVLEDAREVHLRGLQRRHQAEHHGRHEREGDAEEEDASVERKIEHDRDVDGQLHRARRPHQPPREHQTRDTRGARRA